MYVQLSVISYQLSVISYQLSVIRAERLKRLRVSIVPLLLLGGCFLWQPVDACGQDDHHLRAICTTLQNYMATNLPPDMSKAIAIQGMGDLTVLESYPSAKPTLSIKKDVPRGERTYIWKPLDERLEYCTVLGAFFELGDTETQWLSNAVILKNALDNRLSSVSFNVVFGTKRAISKTLAIQRNLLGEPIAVLQEGVDPIYDKRFRLPAKKGVPDTKTLLCTYLMNFEIKLITSLSWAAWDANWQRDNNLHRKYINIHLNLPPKR